MKCKLHHLLSPRPVFLFLSTVSSYVQDGQPHSEAKASSLWILYVYISRTLIHIELWTRISPCRGFWTWTHNPIQRNPIPYTQHKIKDLGQRNGPSEFNIQDSEPLAVRRLSECAKILVLLASCSCYRKRHQDLDIVIFEAWNGLRKLWRNTQSCYWYPNFIVVEEFWKYSLKLGDVTRSDSRDRQPIFNFQHIERSNAAQR
jgi:hypothetical protein